MPIYIRFVFLFQKKVKAMLFLRKVERGTTTGSNNTFIFLFFFTETDCRGLSEGKRFARGSPEVHPRKSTHAGGERFWLRTGRIKEINDGTTRSKKSSRKGKGSGRRFLSFSHASSENWKKELQTVLLGTKYEIWKFEWEERRVRQNYKGRNQEENLSGGKQRKKKD